MKSMANLTTTRNIVLYLKVIKSFHHVGGILY